MAPNELLKEYFELNKLMADLKKRQDSLRDLLLAKGSHGTKEYACTVSNSERRQVAKIADIEEVPSIWKDLLKAGLVKSVSVTTVKVERKAS